MILIGRRSVLWESHNWTFAVTNMCPRYFTEFTGWILCAGNLSSRFTLNFWFSPTRHQQPKNLSQLSFLPKFIPANFPKIKQNTVLCLLRSKRLLLILASLYGRFLSAQTPKQIVELLSPKNLRFPLYKFLLVKLSL